MKIFATAKLNNTFGAKPLYPINLKSSQVEKEILPAHFVELDYFDEHDIDLMLKINKLWVPKLTAVDYASTICKNFFKSQRSTWTRRFFAVQLDNNERDSYKKTALIMETTNPERFPKTYLEINFLQAATAIQPGFSPVKVKGAGAQAIMGAIKFAQAYGLDCVKVFSTNDGFYEKIGLPRIKKCSDGTYFGLDKFNFDKFVYDIQQIYSK